MKNLIDLVCINHLTGDDDANSQFVDMLCINQLSRPNRNRRQTKMSFDIDDIENIAMGRPLI